MSQLYLLITITDRSRLPAFVELYERNQIGIHYVTLCHGTAKREILSTMSLESTEKGVCFSFVTDTTWKKTKRCLERELRIDVPGTGIAFIVPMSSIAGKRELAMITENQHFEKGDEETLKETKRELVTVICNQGYSEMVMDVARAKGAHGGTVIHAKGTGTVSAERFLGVSLASEKDIIFIVTKTEDKKVLMESISRDAGMKTAAKAIAFSMPVTDTAGLRLLDDETEEVS